MADRNTEHDKLKIRYLEEKYSDPITGREKIVSRPNILVRLRNPSDGYWNSEFFALVDSGADSSFASRSICDSLNVKASDSTRRISYGAGGPITTFEVKMEVSIIYPPHEIPLGTITFSVSESAPKGAPRLLLLGRDCFFDKYEITFKEAEKYMTFERTDKTKA